MSDQTRIGTIYRWQSTKQNAPKIPKDPEGVIAARGARGRDREGPRALRFVVGYLPLMSVHVFDRESMPNPACPTHGPTGSLIVRCELTRHRETYVDHVLEPGPPSRSVPVFDEDGEIVDERMLTEDEFARATASYERRLAEWERTCGTVISAGPITVSFKAECQDGSTCEGMFDQNNAVRWTSVETLPRATVSR